MKWVLFHGLFGTWGWERLDAEGTVVAESMHEFETQEDCLDDARVHGYSAAHDELIVPDIGGEEVS